MTRPVRARVDAAALRHNLSRVKALAPRSEVMAVVKADAYGHGLVWAAQQLRQADAFAVAGVDEAISLREAGIYQPICLLSGFFGSDELVLLSAYRLSPALHSLDQVRQLANARLPHPVTVWLKLDTGMHRLGLQPQQLDKAMATLRDSDAVSDVNLMTHFACADDETSPATHDQIKQFAEVSAGFEGRASLANSAGICAWPDSHQQTVRPGIMLYGSSPLMTRSAADLDLRAVMTLESRLIAVRDLKEGDRVGYGGDWQCPRDMRIGVIACGYGDGYPRHAPAGTPVLVNGRAAPLAGRVSMDLITVDLSGHMEARVDDTVVLWGENLPVDGIAMAAGTISYELLCQVTSRVPRVAVNEC